MAFSAKADVEIRARLENFQREMERVPGMTKKAMRQFSRDWISAQKSAQREAEKTAKAAQKTATSFQQLEKAGSSIGGALGGTLGRIKSFGELMQGGVGPAAALTAALAGSTIAVGSFASHVWDTTRNIDDLTTKLGVLTTRELAGHIAAVKDANSAQKSMDESLTALSITLAAIASPAVTTAADTISGVAEATRELADALNTPVGEGLTSAAGWLAQLALPAWASATLNLADRMVDIFGASGAAIREEREKAAEEVAAYEAQLAGAEALGLAGAALTSNGTPATTSGGRTPTSRAPAATARPGLGDARSDMQRYADALAAEMDAETQHKARMLALEREHDDAVAQIEANAAARRLQMQEQQLAFTQNAIAVAGQSVEAVGSLIGTVIDAQTVGLKEGSVAQKRAAREGFIAYKLTAIAMAGIQTAQAVLSTIAQLGAPPSPLGIAGIAAAGVMGAANVASIMAQQPPFHSGGVVGMPAGQAGNVPIMAQTGEYVVDRQRVRQAGGPEGLASMLRNRQPEPARFVLDFGDEQLETLARRLERHMQGPPTGRPPGR